MIMITIITERERAREHGVEGAEGEEERES